MNKLKYYRGKIDNIDKKITKLLILRFNLAKQISNHKKIHKIRILDNKRELQVLSNVKNFSKQHQKFILEIFKNIINYSKKIQK